MGRRIACGLGLSMALVPALVFLLACAPRAARDGRRRPDGWWRIAAQRVVLTTDLPYEDARELVWTFEDQQRALEAAVPGCVERAPSADALPPPPLEVVVMGSGYTFQRVLGSSVAAAVFLREQESLAALPPRIVMANAHFLATTFTHEATHRWVERCFPGAPRWLDEGLAAFFETLRVHEDRVVVGVPRYRFDAGGPRHGVRGDGAPIEQVPPSELFSMTELRAIPVTRWVHESSSEVRPALYATAWAFTHLGLVGGSPALRDAFVAFLGDLHTADEPAEVAFDRRFEGIDVDAALRDYVATFPSLRGEMPYAPPRIPRPSGQRLAESQRHLLFGELATRRATSDATRAVAREELALVGPSERLDAELLLLVLSGHGGDLAEIAQRTGIDLGDRRLVRAQAMLALAEGPRALAVTALAGLRRLEHPSSGDVTLEAWLELAQGNFEATRELAEHALAIEPLSFSARRAWATASFALGRYDDARTGYRRALATLDDSRTATRQDVEAWMALLDAREDALAARGPDVPPTAVVTREQLATLTGAARPAIRACYAGRERRVWVAMVLEATGRVRTIAVRSAGADREGDACAETVVGTLPYPPPEGGVPVALDFTVLVDARDVTRDEAGVTSPP